MENRSSFSKEDYKRIIANQIHPVGFENADGRFNVECTDEGMLTLTMTMLEADHKWYMDKEQDWVQKLEFSFEDLDRLIEILQAAKKINTLSWESVLKRIE